MPQPRVVIVGGGFAGLNAAQALRRTPVDVTLIDRRNFHLFQPLLYQVATGGLSPGNIAAPLRSILQHQKNCRVVLADVEGFDLARRTVILKDGEVSFDYLIVAAGARSGYFGHPEWSEAAPGLKSIEDALEIRRRILSTFELAERETDLAVRKRLLTFVIIGGGPTGVELAGTLAEIASHTLRHEFRNITPGDANILLVDLSPRILEAFPERLSQSANDHLRKLGVHVQSRTRVVSIDAHSIVVERDGQRETISASTILWAAGVQASGLGPLLADAAGVEADRMGRVPVLNDLSVMNHPDVFVVGDLARCLDDAGKPLPGVAPVAIQQGKYLGRAITARLRSQTVGPFRYHDLGSMATIGRSAAVAQLGRWQFRGWIAWVLWLFVHLMQLVSFENRLLVLLQWAWNYFTFSRSARLITKVGPRE